MSWSNSLYDYVMGKLTDWADKRSLISDLQTLTWIYRYKTYEEALMYCEGVKQKYPEDLDIDLYTHRAKVYARFYFHKS